MLEGTLEADGAYQEDDTVDVEALVREAAGWDRHLEFARFQVLLSSLTPKLMLMPMLTLTLVLHFAMRTLSQL